MDRNQKAFQLWEQGQPTEAIELLFKEIDTHPENMDSYYNLATMLMLAQKYEDAKAVLTLANEKRPIKAIYFMHLAIYIIKRQIIHKVSTIFHKYLRSPKQSKKMLPLC